MAGNIWTHTFTQTKSSMERDVKDTHQYAIVASVHLPGVSDEEFAASLTELRELAKTLGFKVIRTFVQKRAGFDSTAYLGEGKRQEIRRFVHGDADDETASDDASRLSAQTDDAETCLKRGCKNFCVNGHLAGDCRFSRESRNDRKQRTDRQPAG